MVHKKIKERLVKLAKDNEKSMDEIKALFESCRLLAKENEPDLDSLRLDKRAYGNLKSFFENKKYNKGEEFSYIPIGVAIGAKDKNEELRNKILKEWSDPTKRLEMIQSGKVMTMKIGEDKVPVKKITKMTEVNDEWIVEEAEICDLGKGDTPIPRNYVKNKKYKNKEGTYPNFDYSKPLYPKWELTLNGIGFFPGVKGDGEEKVKKKIVPDGRKAKVTFKGKFANPNDPLFVCANPIWFTPLRFKAIYKKDRSTPIKMECTCSSQPELIDKKIDFIKIAKALNKSIATNFDNLKKEALEIRNKAKTENNESLMKDAKEKLSEAKFYEPFKKKNYIPNIDLDEIDKYHNEHSAIWIEEEYEDFNGEVAIRKSIKKDGDWDVVDFDAFAIAEVDFNGIYHKDKTKPPKMIIGDWSLDDSLFVKYSPEINVKIPPGTAVVSITTSKGNSVYDKESGEYVKDPKNAKPNPKIRGIRVTSEFENSKEMLEKKLEGDMK